MSRNLVVAIVLASAACSSGTQVSVAPSPSPAHAKHLTWFQRSAEYPAITLQVYRQATNAVLAAARDLPAGTWAVILDADETIIDNSEHERRTLAAGVSFSDSSWVPWVRERAADRKSTRL